MAMSSSVSACIVSVFAILTLKIPFRARFPYNDGMATQIVLIHTYFLSLFTGTDFTGQTVMHVHNIYSGSKNHRLSLPSYEKAYLFPYSLHPPEVPAKDQWPGIKNRRLVPHWKKSYLPGLREGFSEISTLRKNKSQTQCIVSELPFAGTSPADLAILKGKKHLFQP